MARTVEDILAGIAGVIVGIIGGLAIAAILDAILKPKCPVCNNPLEYGEEYCPKCKTALRWE